MTESLKLFDTYEEYLDAHLVDEDLYYLKGDHDPNFVQTWWIIKLQRQRLPRKFKWLLIIKEIMIQ